MNVLIIIILASMSLGYWIGGKNADKNANTDKISEILLTLDASL